MGHETTGQLLLACLSTEWAEETVTNLGQLSETDWHTLFRLAENQLVAPLLYHRLKTHRQESLIPPPLQQQWQKQYYFNAVRNLRLYQELASIVMALHEQGIPSLVLKGGHLARTAYDSPGLRYMADIDIMIPQQEAPRTVKKLLELGYEPFSPVKFEAYFATGRHLPRFIHREKSVTFEVHWTITSPSKSYTIAMEDLWARAIPFTWDKVETLGLCPEDLLLHVCLHATYQHCLEQGIRSLCDIDALVRHAGCNLDWTQVQNHAHTWGWTKGAYLILYLAQQWLATPIPDSVLQSLQPDDFTPLLAQEAINHLFTNRAITSTMTDEFSKLWVAPGMVEKIGVGLRRLFLPRQIMTQLYPVAADSPKVYWYYFVRLTDLLIRYKGAAQRLQRGEPEVINMANRRNTLLHWLGQA